MFQSPEQLLSFQKDEGSHCSSQTQDLTSSPSDDWSDPCPASTHADGVTIPPLMKELLGINFVPYLPPPEVSSPSRQNNDHDQRLQIENPTKQDNDSSLNPEETQPQTTPDVDSSIEVYLDDTASLRGENRKGRNKSLGSAIRRAWRMRRNRRRSPAYAAVVVSPVDNDSDVKLTPTSSAGEIFCEVDSESTAFLDILNDEQERLAQLKRESALVSRRAEVLTDRVSSLQSEVSDLRQALGAAMNTLKEEEVALSDTKAELFSLEEQAIRAVQNVENSIQRLRNGELSPRGVLQMELLPPLGKRQRSFSTEKAQRSPGSSLGLSSLSSHSGISDTSSLEIINRPRAHTEPHGFKAALASFIRVEDLELGQIDSPSSIHSAPAAIQTTTRSGFFQVEHDVPLVLDRLFELGFSVATDESTRFEPTRDTSRLLQKNRSLQKDSLPGWPIVPWHVAGDEIYVWTGGVPHSGFGHDWPVVKARTIVRTDPLNLLNFLLDSNQVKTYNKMSQGREDVLVLQTGVNTKASDSPYGIPGEARVMRTLTKPKLLPKTIEVLSLWYARPLENAPGGYMIVNRSVWEDDSGRHKASDEDRMLRSEMLLGVFLLRPVKDCSCELTTITHVFSPGVPERIAKRFAPTTATAMLQNIQDQFASGH